MKAIAIIAATITAIGIYATGMDYGQADTYWPAPLDPYYGIVARTARAGATRGYRVMPEGHSYIISKCCACAGQYTAHTRYADRVIHICRRCGATATFAQVYPRRVATLDEYIASRRGPQ